MHLFASSVADIYRRYKIAVYFAGMSRVVNLLAAPPAAMRTRRLWGRECILVWVYLANFLSREKQIVDMGEASKNENLHILSF